MALPPDGMNGSIKAVLCAAHIEFFKSKQMTMTQQRYNSLGTRLTASYNSLLVRYQMQSSDLPTHQTHLRGFSSVVCRVPTISNFGTKSVAARYTSRDPTAVEPSARDQLVPYRPTLSLNQLVD